MTYLCLYIKNSRIVLSKHFRNSVLVCGIFLILMSIVPQRAWSQPPGCETNTVFVTTKKFTTDLLWEAKSNFEDCAGVRTGLQGADCICQGLADAQGLDGTYKAFLSDSMDSPSTIFTQSTCPYVMVNGVQIADNWTDLTDGDINTCIRIDETGGVLVDICDNFNDNGNYSVLTNTLTDGTTKGTQNCGDWTINDQDLPGVHGGLFDHYNSGWTDRNPISWNCNNPGRRLYCFEQSDVTIPTFSQWGLIALAGVLGIVGLIVIRRRKAAA